MAAVQLPALARSLSQSDFASASVVIAGAAYFSLATAEPHTLAFQRHPGSPAALGNFTIATRRVLSWSGVGILVAFLIGVLTEHTAVWMATAGWGIGIAVTRLVSTAWLSWLKPWRYSINLMASTGARTGVLLGLLLMDAPLWVALMSAGLASAITAVVIGPRVLLLLFADRHLAPPWTLAFGLNLAVASLFYAVLMNASLLALTALTTTQEAASFAAMLQIGTISVSALLGLITTTMYPYIRVAWDAGLRDAALRRLEGAGLAIVSIALTTAAALTVGDGLIVKMFVGPGLSRVGLLGLIFAGFMFGSLGMIENSKHQFMLRSNTIAARGLVAAIVGVALSFALPALMDPSLGSALAFCLGLFTYYHAMAWDNEGGSLTVLISSISGVMFAVSSFLTLSSAVEAVVFLSLGIVAGLIALSKLRASRS